MKLNHDCIRDLLLEIESFPLDTFPLQGPNLVNVSNKYSSDDLIYSVQQLLSAKYIEGTCDGDFSGEYIIVIDTITWEGNKFLDNIRSPKVWSEVSTSISKKIGSASLTILSSVAAKFIESSLGL